MDRQAEAAPSEQPAAFVGWHKAPAGPWTKILTAPTRDEAWQGLRDERLHLGESAVLPLGTHPRKRFHG
jgi:hypothetical protein